MTVFKIHGEFQTVEKPNFVLLFFFSFHPNEPTWQAGKSFALASHVFSVFVC